MSAILYDEFVDQVAKLKSAADNAGDASTGAAQREWYIPTGWAGDPFSVAALGTPFLRADINSGYSQFFTQDDGRVADAMAAKLQGRYLSALERSFRMRYLSPIRGVMHAANRRHGQAISGSVFDRVEDHVADVIISRSAGD